MHKNTGNTYTRPTSECQHINISHLEAPLCEIPEEPRYSPDHRLHPWIARSAFDAFDTINEIKHQAFNAGGSNYSCPAQTQ